MAAKSVNKVILIGNLGKDPEVKYTPSGTPVAKITLATNERFKDKSGEWQDRTEWHNVVLWQRLAEIAGEYLKKGGKVYIEGRLQTRSWDDKTSGQKKYMTEVVASDLILLGGRGEGAAVTMPAAGRAAQQQVAATTLTSVLPKPSLPPQARSRMKTFLSRKGRQQQPVSISASATRLNSWIAPSAASRGASLLGSRESPLNPIY